MRCIALGSTEHGLLFSCQRCDLAIARSCAILLIPNTPLLFSCRRDSFDTAVPQSPYSRFECFGAMEASRMAFRIFVQTLRLHEHTEAFFVVTSLAFWIARSASARTGFPRLILPVRTFLPGSRSVRFFAFSAPDHLFWPGLLRCSISALRVANF